MSSTHDAQRRRVMAALASLPLLGTAHGSDSQARSLGGSKILIAYFTRSGNTKVVAGLLQRAQQADLFEIRTATGYPEDYLETVEQARQERDSNFEPALAAYVANMADYDTVFLGFPIWGETTPPVIRSFLSAHDLAGKTLIPFVTHGGYGVGNSHCVLASHAPKATLQQGYEMQADQERKTMEHVNSWLSGLKLQA